MTFTFGGGFVFPKVYVTTPIIKGPTVTKVHLTVIYTGTIGFKISADGGTNWESVNLTSGVRTEHALANTGTELKFMAIGNPGSRITTTNDASGNYDEPGIKIEITETN